MMRRRIFLAAAALALAGCASDPRKDEDRIRGRFSLTLGEGAEARNQTGRFECVKRKDHLRLDLLTPLSGMIARIESDPSGARFYRQLDEPPVKAPSLEELLLRVTGFSLPVESLPEIPKTVPPARSSARGWTVETTARFPSGRPRTLRFSRKTSGLLVSLTVVLDHEAA